MIVSAVVLALSALAGPPIVRAQPCDRVAVIEQGRVASEICAESAGPRTVVDLSDAWAPPFLDGTEVRATFAMLADERDEDLPSDVPAERDLELLGVPPSFRVVRARLADDGRHRCHDEVDGAALAELGARTIRRQTERPTDDRTRAAVRAAQQHLVCERLLRARPSGVLDGATARAIAAYQRRHAIVGTGALDSETRDHMLAGSRELDFRAALRALRERVASASGAVEDGSARGEWGTVLGRTLDATAIRSLVGHPPAEHGAADWISEATEAAAIALGWTSPSAFLAALTPARAAIALPSSPRPFGRALEIRAEIDRGDVRRARHARPAARRPILTVYARDGDREIALVRWPTTIGGWQLRRAPDGAIARRYHESPVGARVWRDLVAAPVWLPPGTTPDRELLRRDARGRWEPDLRSFGPGHRSAYGLAMLMHHRPIVRGGEARLADEGVRTHGSVHYGSIVRGSSHGCHRLYNHLALRLAGFLLAHRAHVRSEPEPIRYERTLRAPDGSVHRFRIASRGVRYELVPPVPVDVLRGRDAR